MIINILINTDEIQKKIYRSKKSIILILFENNENFIIYTIENLDQIEKPDIKDKQIRR